MMRLVILLGMAVLTVRGEPVKLFDGRSLDGWCLKGAPYWSVEGGVLSGQSDSDKRHSILWTKRSFKDFTLEFEFRCEGKVDSGIFLRHEDDHIQIGTSSKLKRDMTGSPFISSKGGYPVEAKGVAGLLKDEGWNRMKIVAKGRRYRVILNGTEILDYESDTAAEKGPIGLEVHSGVEMKVAFRGLRVSVPKKHR